MDYMDDVIFICSATYTNDTRFYANTNSHITSPKPEIVVTS